MGLNEALSELNLVEQQVRGLESRLDGARRMVRAQEIKADQLTQQHHELTSQLKHTQAQAANIENDVKGAEQRIATLREQMNSVKTNKEYSAMLVEVNTLKTDKGKLEEQALELLGQVDQFQSEIDELDKVLADQSKVKAHAEKELADRTAEVGERLAELKLERAEKAKPVPPEVLDIFERMAENFDGEAMAPVVEQDRRRMEYICGGCYMTIPVEMVNRLITQDKLTRCTSCQRILYIEQELKAEMGT